MGTIVAELGFDWRSWEVAKSFKDSIRFGKIPVETVLKKTSLGSGRPVRSDHGCPGQSEEHLNKGKGQEERGREAVRAPCLVRYWRENETERVTKFLAPATQWMSEL